ncbi:pyridine nucleotide-disulfide oxidoreductase [Amycolatopsis sp. WAC 01375]|uniref:FAD-dependent oxidoreductase n=1 Tax=Amycolatopsis sp. WAC 01375 TaxID=2203194 RepID=UPI000F783582|nr:FAD-dependent monooxygenase [Amycolatopsis sp. WAC 01375]RSM80767.1 pyridine nucleotide-disulfide oxidoreductase [Amycolatopsis sp. WAC 01375]
MTGSVVLGGGLAGMLAAAALARHCDTVTVVDGDTFPAEPAPRRGLPQGKHSHMFMAGGVEALNALVPGAVDALVAGGANRRGMPWAMLTLSAGGWFPRHEGPSYIVVCSRDLIDHVVRDRVLRDPKISLVPATRVVGLTGDSARVTGARVSGADDVERALPADFVVDATGRRSKAPEWLAELGVDTVDEEFVDSGLAYATRLFTAPKGTSPELPAVLVQPRAGTGEPGRGGTLFPIEGDRWIVTMTGTRGGEPPTDDAGFVEFARSLPSPLIAELFAKAEPITDVAPYRGTVNRRRHFERIDGPEGFVVLGDALAALNPVYAHGMSVAAQEALALRDELDSIGVKPGLAAAAQAAIAARVETPWAMAGDQDLAFPDVRTNRRPSPPPSQQELDFLARMAQTALSEPEVANALFGVYTLITPQAEMMTPRLLELIERGPTAAPLTAEAAVANFPEFGDLL